MLSHGRGIPVYCFEKGINSMTVDEILKKLERNRGYFPRKAVEEAQQRKDEITPYLLDGLRNVIENTEERAAEEDWFFHIYSMFLLAQFREKRAFPLIIDFLKQPWEYVDALMSDTITEDIPRVLASVYDGDTDKLKSIIEDPDRNEYLRSSVLRVLRILVHEDLLSRDCVISYFTELFRGRLEKESSNVWNELTSETVSLHAASLQKDIEGSFKAGLVYPGYISPEYVKKRFSRDTKTAMEYSAQYCDRPVENTVKELEWWACFKPERKKNSRPADDFAAQSAAETYVRDEPRVGRNDPCPCGSGKKYKKCCLGRTDIEQPQAEPAVTEASGPESHTGKVLDSPFRTFQPEDTDNDQIDQMEDKLESINNLKDRGAGFLLNRLSETGINITPEQFKLLAERYISGVNLFNSEFAGDFQPAGDFDVDHAIAAVCVLWEKLMDRPCIETVNDLVDKGYDLDGPLNIKARIEAWTLAWKALPEFLPAPPLDLLKGVDSLYRYLTFDIEEWFWDFAFALEDAEKSGLEPEYGLKDFKKDFFVLFPDQTDCFDAPMREEEHDEYLSPEEKARFEEVTGLTDSFCEAHLNEDYKELCRELADELIMEDEPAIMRGRVDIWAAAIVTVIGYVNFLNDKEQTPHMQNKQIAELFGVSVSSMQNRARQIRVLFDIDRFDPAWALPNLAEKDPRLWMVDINGFRVDARSCSRDQQEEFFSRGLIPWVPAARPEISGKKQDIKTKLDAPDKPGHDKKTEKEKKYHEIEGPTLFDKEIE